MRGPQSRAGWRVWLPALLVAASAVAATAHGIYEVAIASRVPWGVALLYPLITDGLALVAYASTHRLRGWAAGYAWLVTILAAGLSGLAQAAYLASEPLVASQEIRFGVGAWPAVAAAIVAHLLYLLARPPARQQKVADSPATPAATLAPATTATPVAPPATRPVTPARLTSATPLANGPGPWAPRKVAEPVAERHTTSPASQPPATRVASQRPAALRQSSATTVTASAAMGGANASQSETDVEKATRLIASDTGRPTLARELDIEPHHARALLDDAKAGVLDDPKDLAERLSRYQEAARAARARKQKEAVSA